MVNHPFKPAVQDETRPGPARPGPWLAATQTCLCTPLSSVRPEDPPSGGRGEEGYVTSQDQSNLVVPSLLLYEGSC
jgi:hypothetical protein